MKAARIMVLAIPEPGHVHPFIGVAQHLEAAGHQLAFFAAFGLRRAGLDIRPWLERASIQAQCFTPPQQPHVAPDRRMLTKMLGNRASAKMWYRAGGLAPVPLQVEALRTAVRDWRPDLLCIDPLVYAGPIVALQENLPWAVISPLLVALTPTDFRCTFLELLDEQTAERDQIFRSFGVVPPHCKLGEVQSPWLNTVFTTEEFVPRANADNEVSLYIGPSRTAKARGDEPAFPWERLRSDVPLIYVSFGSQLTPPMQVIEAIAAAVEPGEAQLVLALNDLIDAPDLPALRDDIIAVRYAPQTALLDRAAVMIAHGGVNGVAEALSRGVPLLVIPLGHEQPLQAHFVERSGAGAALLPEHCTVEAVRSQLHAAMAPSTRARAEAIRRSYDAADGAARAAALLVDLARTREPVSVM